MFKSQRDAIQSISKRLAVYLLAVFVLPLLSFHVFAKDSIVAIDGRTMGTTYNIKWVVQPNIQPLSTDKVKASVDKLLLEINQSMSTYIKDSELSILNTLPAKSQATVSTGLYQVLSLAQSISLKSDGAYDVTVGPLVNLWGFGPQGRIIKRPSAESIAEVRKRIGFNKLVLLPDNQIKKEGDIYIDLSSIAKGYGVDQLAQLLESFGIANYLVEIGGELRTKGKKPQNQDWRIAIESPTAGRTIQKVVKVSGKAVATSGDYRNYFEEDGVRYSHTIDTKTASPVSHNLASVTVMADSCALADALATAFLAMGLDKAYQYAVEHKIDAFFITKEKTGFEEKMTPGFALRLNN